VRTSTSVLIGCRKLARTHSHAQPRIQPHWGQCGQLRVWGTFTDGLTTYLCLAIENSSPKLPHTSHHRHGDRFLLLRFACLPSLFACRGFPFVFGDGTQPQHHSPFSHFSRFSPFSRHFTREHAGELSSAFCLTTKGWQFHLNLIPLSGTLSALSVYSNSLVPSRT